MTSLAHVSLSPKNPSRSTWMLCRLCFNFLPAGFFLFFSKGPNPTEKKAFYASCEHVGWKSIFCILEFILLGAERGHSEGTVRRTESIPKILIWWMSRLWTGEPLCWTFLIKWTLLGMFRKLSSQIYKIWQICCLYLPLLLQENSRITHFKLTKSLNTSTSIWQTRFKRYFKAEVRTGSRTSTFHSSLQTLKCLTTLFSRGIPPPYSAFYKQLFPSNNFENPTVKALEQ